MSYEKHTWVTNEAITASKMNNIETGIEEASQSGGGGDVVLFYYPNSTVGWQTTGDFNAALGKVQNGVPFLAGMMTYDTFSGGYTTHLDYYMAIVYDENFPNQIDLQITGGVGIIWTANGLEYYD